MKMLKNVSFRPSAEDFRFLLRQSPKERAIAGGLALLIPAIMIYVFIIDSKTNTYTYVPQEVIYVENWSSDRTDEDILRDRWQIQCRKDKFEAKRRESIKNLGRLSGIDVEQMEREIEEAKSARGEVEVERPAGLTC